MDEFEEALAIFDEIWARPEIRHVLVRSYESNYYSKAPSWFEELLGAPKLPPPESETIKKHWEESFTYGIRMFALEKAAEVRSGKTAQEVFRPCYRFRVGPGEPHYELFINRSGPPMRIPVDDFNGDSERRKTLATLGLKLNDVRKL